MSQKEYLTVQEFADAAKVSVQSIYKRMKKPTDSIQKYIKLLNGKKVIAAQALEVIYSNKGYEELEQKEEPNNQENELVNILKKQVESLQKDLDTKNEQINDLIEQVKESGEREKNLHTLLNQQQQLAAADKQRILKLESAASKKKKGFLNFFKRKEEQENE